MLEPRKNRRALLAKLDTLRLLVAQEIICNGLNTRDERFNISSEAASNELCDQYCIKLFLLWVATKYGFAAYPLDVKQGALRLPVDPDRYPFYQVTARTPPCVAHIFEWLDANLDPRIEIVGDLYMQTMQSTIVCVTDNKLRVQRKSNGRLAGEFYTPPEIVEVCLDALQERAGQAPPLRGDTVLDPACGTGNFLLGVLRRTQDPLGACKRIHGLDIDARAVEIARLSLLIACGKQLRKHGDQRAVDELWNALKRNIRVGDATASKFDTKFDLVVTNPPYISFGSRDHGQLLPSHAEFLRRRFPESSQYKIRLHSIFQQLCIQLCSERGQAILLVPDAFLTGAFYSNLRRFIAENAQMVSLTELPESTFPDATAGKWCIACYSKRHEGEVVLRQIFDDGTNKSFAMEAAALVDKNDKHRFRLVFDRMGLDIITTLSNLPRVRSAFRGHTGIRARNGQASIIAANKSTRAHERGLISGSEVTPHHITWSGNYLNIDAKLLFGGGFDHKVIHNPKVLVRQTADRLIGALDLSGFYHLNNVHSFASTLGDPMHQCAFLTALINSRLWLYLYRLKSREEGRALAQIDIEMVESLPLPECSPDVVKLASAATLALPHANGQAAAIGAALDRLIYSAYSLDEQQIAHIERCLQASGIAPTLPSSEEALNLLKSLASAEFTGSRR